ncbi:MAG: SGNH/GDSL hydrolase family protein [Sphingobacteriales bacterium]
MRIGIVLIIIIFFSGKTFAQNLDFEQGMAGWHTTGKISIDKTDKHNGNACAKIESGSIYQVIPVKPLAVVQFDAYVKSSQKGIKCYSFIRFYNIKHKKLLQYISRPPDSAGYRQTGNYTESPALSSYMEVGIEKEGAAGVIYADDFKIEANVGSPKINHEPLVDLDQYMKPFWHSDTVYNETVLLYSKNGSRAAGELLYQPDRILSVRSFDLKRAYGEDKDYSRSGNVIIRTTGSAMPFRADTSFDTKKDLAWFNTESQWIVVTYTHHDTWTGPVPAYKGSQMPLTIAKLRAKKRLTIVAYGMSITRGMDVSGYDTIPPYMPTYVSLFARQLGKSYHYAYVKLYNAGLPGSTVDWGAQYAAEYVNPLKPDLVILDFGMNDFWRLTPEQFKGYMQTMIGKIRASNPNVEFILLSNMKFDPAYVLDSDQYKSFYTGNLEGYSNVLKQMETRGVINLDMYAISSFIYDHKKAKDCIANPLHPNDYLARWYAQGLAAQLILPSIK